MEFNRFSSVGERLAVLTFSRQRIFGRAGIYVILQHLESLEFVSTAGFGDNFFKLYELFGNFFDGEEMDSSRQDGRLDDH